VTTNDDDATRDAPERARRGVEILHDPMLNKGTAFTEAERDALGLRGLLPPRAVSPEIQALRVLENYRRKTSDLERYLFLAALQDRNERLFLRTLIDNIESMLGVVYTPTVGEACKLFGHIFSRPRGLYVTARDRGRVREVLANWPRRDVSVIVLTDGERILGLGDLGANGMGIPIGKLNLYSALGGIDPARSLPILLDAGTDNRSLREDPFYLGLDRERLRGDAYDSLVEELMDAIAERFPRALVQFEDFATHNAFALLERYGPSRRVFNDDIQGTAAVTLAAILASSRLSWRRLEDERLLFVGAGGAAGGIARLFVAALERRGVAHHEALARCWLVDSQGLVVSSRAPLPPHKALFAHDHVFLSRLDEIVRALRPTVLVGVSGVAGAFTRTAIEAMAGCHERPLVLALSNPTSSSECTPEDAYRWSSGRAIVATGSPFEPVVLDGVTHVPGQCNNCYVFPGVGLGVVASGAARVTEEMFLAAARALAAKTPDDRLAHGCLFARVAEIRNVSVAIAAAVVRTALEEQLTSESIPDDVEAWLRSRLFSPEYRELA